MTRVYGPVLAILLVGQNVFAGNLYNDLQAAERRQQEREAKHAINRAVGWFGLGLIAIGGSVYYTTRSNRESRSAQMIRDRAMTHGDVVYMSYGHKPKEPPPPPPPPQIEINTVDLTPARDRERRASIYSRRADYFLAGAVLCGALGGLNVNKYIQIHADMDKVELSARKKF